MYALGVAMALIADAKEVVLVLYLLGALNALLAVPVAVFLLVRNPYYINRANIVLTLLAAIPFVLLVMVVVTLGAGGPFHI